MGKRGTLLKELDDSLSQVQTLIKKGADEQKMDLYKRQFRALTEINEYVSTYEWAGHEKNREKLRMIRESGFDYDFIRSELNMSSDALKSFLYRNNQKLEKYIGETTLDLIMSKNNTVGYGLMNFRLSAGIYKPEDIFMPYCYERFPEGKFDFIKLFESEPELRFLYTYSKVGFEEALANIDMTKLSALLYILKNPNIEKYREEQKDFIQVLLGINMTFEDYLMKLDNQRFEYDNQQEFVSRIIDDSYVSDYNSEEIEVLKDLEDFDDFDLE